MLPIIHAMPSHETLFIWLTCEKALSYDTSIKGFKITSQERSLMNRILTEHMSWEILTNKERDIINSIKNIICSIYSIENKENYIAKLDKNLDSKEKKNGEKIPKNFCSTMDIQPIINGNLSDEMTDLVPFTEDSPMFRIRVSNVEHNMSQYQHYMNQILSSIRSYCKHSKQLEEDITKIEQSMLHGAMNSIQQQSNGRRSRSSSRCSTGGDEDNDEEENNIKNWMNSMGEFLPSFTQLNQFLQSHYSTISKVSNIFEHDFLVPIQHGINIHMERIQQCQKEYQEELKAYESMLLNAFHPSKSPTKLKTIAKTRLIRSNSTPKSFNPSSTKTTTTFLTNSAGSSANNRHEQRQMDLLYDLQLQRQQYEWKRFEYTRMLNEFDLQQKTEVVKRMDKIMFDYFHSLIQPTSNSLTSSLTSSYSKYQNEYKRKNYEERLVRSLKRWKSIELRLLQQFQETSISVYSNTPPKVRSISTSSTPLQSPFTTSSTFDKHHQSNNSDNQVFTNVIEKKKIKSPFSFFRKKDKLSVKNEKQIEESIVKIQSPTCGEKESKGGGVGIIKQGYLFVNLPSTFSLPMKYSTSYEIPDISSSNKKKGAIKKKRRWYRLWCILDSGFLSFAYVSKTDKLQIQNLCELKFCSIRQSSSNASDKHFDIRTSKKEEYRFEAENEEDGEAWKQTIQASILHQIGSHESNTYSSSSEDEEDEGDIDIGVQIHAQEKLETEICNEKLTFFMNQNPSCADCMSSDVPADWCSINLGITLCIDCSGIHRSLGVHVSKIRSLSLDRWSDMRLLEAITTLGNQITNELYLYNNESPPEFFKDHDEKIAFIRSKYAEKLFLPPDFCTFYQLRYPSTQSLSLTQQEQETIIIQAIQHNDLPTLQGALAYNLTAIHCTASFLPHSPIPTVIKSYTLASHLPWSLMHVACAFGNVVCADYLLQNGILMTSFDQNQCTPLDVAMLCSQTKVLEWWESK